MTDKIREAVARAIWNIRREEEDRCDMELEDMGADHSVWTEADAAIGAMREALVIELPKRADTGVDTGGWPNDSAAHRVNCAIAQCAMAIGAAGLKVKP